MMTLNTGFTCPPTFYFKFITKCAGLILQSATAFLLQSATSVITKCDNFITKCDRYYKVRRLLQSATVHVYAENNFVVMEREILEPICLNFQVVKQSSISISKANSATVWSMEF